MSFTILCNDLKFLDDVYYYFRKYFEKPDYNQTTKSHESNDIYGFELV